MLNKSKSVLGSVQYDLVEINITLRDLDLPRGFTLMTRNPSNIELQCKELFPLQLTYRDKLYTPINIAIEFGPLKL